MTCITVRAVVNIINNLLVFVVHFRKVVFMTVGTGENRIIGRNCMTLSTGIPSPPVVTAEYREILTVMIEC